MRLVTDSLFNAPEDAIGHGVNLQGVMGAGIAVGFRDKYPEMMPSYRQWCETADPGDILLYRAKDGKVVVNLGTQRLPGRDATYPAIVKSLINAVTELRSLGITSLAIPKIGCGIGGLDWDAVKTILALLEIVGIAAEEPFEFVIYSPE